MKRKTEYNLNSMLQCSLFSALLCVLSPFTIPVGTVPISLGIFVVIMCAYVSGWRKGLVSVLIYIALGAVGMPVFAGWQGGFGVLAGPTGGYIWSYIPISVITGICTDMTARRFILVLFGLVSLLVCYMCGLIQYMAVTGVSVGTALTVCVYPFVIFDIIKVWAGLMAGDKIKKSLVKNGFIK